MTMYHVQYCSREMHYSTGIVLPCTLYYQVQHGSWPRPTTCAMRPGPLTCHRDRHSSRDPARLSAARSRVHVGSLLTRETADGAQRDDGTSTILLIEVRISSGPCFRTHVQMTCFTDKRYEDREYLYTRTRARQRQPGDV